ncbi:MAG: acetyltransferase [Planctomycetaceae bacterium]|jgi:sugar O-acyltransferase (sialic acid O-acetyltransferase NeuD family)|nr:acetyltransferase [Planctomycetaceae bacterium]
MQPIIIIGAGGFGREVYALLEDINRTAPTWNVLGFADDRSEALDSFEHYPSLLCPVEQLPVADCRHYVCAVGDPTARRAIVKRLADRGLVWPTLIHPTAAVGPGSALGVGSILCRNSVVTVDATLGNYVHLNLAATVGHDAKVGDFCTLSCQVDICGAAVVGNGVFLGSHASVLPRAKIGDGARVGAGSVVLRTVREGATVFGVPALRTRTSGGDS